MKSLSYHFIRNLDPKAITLYSGNIFPKRSSTTRTYFDRQAELIAVEARSDKTIIGLIIAQIRNNQKAEIISWHVQADWRRNGIGLKLLTILTRMIGKLKSILYSLDTKLQ